jgi:ankyrin repeat protein
MMESFAYNARLSLCNICWSQFGGTALLHAASKGQMAAAVALLAAGADPTRASKGGRNAVHLAAERNHAATIEAMLSSSETCKSECLDAQDKDGRTPLMLAAQGDAAAACKALIASGAGLEIQEHGEGEGPFDTALLLAARLGKVESARALAEAGADYYELDDGSYRALDAARQGSHPSEEVREAMYDMLLDVMLDRE